MKKILIIASLTLCSNVNAQSDSSSIFKSLEETLGISLNWKEWFNEIDSISKYRNCDNSCINNERDSLQAEKYAWILPCGHNSVKVQYLIDNKIWIRVEE